MKKELTYYYQGSLSMKATSSRADYVGVEDYEALEKRASAMEAAVKCLERIVRCHPKGIEKECGFDCLEDAQRAIESLKS